MIESKLETHRPCVVILGSKGRLGSALCRLWSSTFEIQSFSRKELDISRLEEVKATLKKISNGFVVNCAALTDVDYCEEHPKDAFLLNATSPALMAQICAEREIPFIHFSTDYVFGGEQAIPLTEEDSAVPISQYGWSKLEGENAVLRASPAHIVLRVSWVFGPGKRSFIDNILLRALTEYRVEAVADKTSSPTYTHDIAQWMKVFFQNRVKRDPHHLGGLYHLCNSGECSWRDYAQYALDCALNLGIPLKATHVDPLKLEEMHSFKARRPRYSTMSTEKFAGLLGHPLRSWQNALEDYISMRAPHFSS